MLTPQEAGLPVLTPVALAAKATGVTFTQTNHPSPAPAATPEPLTMTLLGFALVALGLVGRKLLVR